jgi:hypothetical protein
MSLNVRVFDQFEVLSLDSEGQEGREVFETVHSIVSESLEKKRSEGHSVQSVNYFAWIVIESNGDDPFKPEQRFGEQTLSVSDFSTLGNDWAANALLNAKPEIDAFIKSRYGGDPV